jgi:hypothetical protein
VLAHVGKQGAPGDNVAVLVFRFSALVQRAEAHRFHVEAGAGSPLVLLGQPLRLRLLDGLDLLAPREGEAVTDGSLKVQFKHYLTNLAQEGEQAKERREAIGEPREVDDQQVIDLLEHEVVLRFVHAESATEDPHPVRRDERVLDLVAVRREPFDVGLLLLHLPAPPTRS